jgi:predicted nucleic acid-binding protein
VAEVLCLDAGVWVKALTPEPLSPQALALVERALQGSALVAPAFCWTEVGSVLRKKVRRGDLDEAAAAAAWEDFAAMPIDFVEPAALHERAWRLAIDFQHPTLYDAAYLACAESVAGGSASYWTADTALIQHLGDRRPAYVHHLADFEEPEG